jgi:hypothetical protein
VAAGDGDGARFGEDVDVGNGVAPGIGDGVGVGEAPATFANSSSSNLFSSA